MRYQFIDEQQPESLLGTAGRGVARGVARATEAIAGAPGDIVSGGVSLLNLGSKALTGQEIPGAQQLQNIIPGSEFVRRNVTEPLTGEYLKPQSDTEQFIDTIIGDIAGLIAPGGLATKASRAALTGLGKVGIKQAAKTVGKQALRAAGANIAGKAAEELTGSPLAGGLVKVGTLIGSSTAGGRNALKEIRKESYLKADQAIRPGDIIQAGDLKSRLKNGQDLLKRSDIADKEFISGRLKAVESNIKQNKLSAKDAVQLRKDMNDWIYRQDISPQAKRYIGRTRDLLNEKLDQYGKTNPNFAEAFNMADDITRGLEAGGSVQKFLNKNVSIPHALKNWKPVSYGTGGLFYVLGKPLGLASLGIGIPTAMTARYVGATYNLLKNSEEARKYYKQILAASLKNDANAVAKSIKAFDHVASKYEESNLGGRYELIS